MGSYKKALAKLKTGSQLRYEEGKLICEKNFERARLNGGSHLKFKTGQKELPFILLQPEDGKMKAYQQRQLLEAIQRKENDER